MQNDTYATVCEVSWQSLIKMMSFNPMSLFLVKTLLKQECRNPIHSQCTETFSLSAVTLVIRMTV